MGKKKLTYSFVKNQFEKDDYHLLSDEYVNCRIKLRYRCPKGHNHSISWDNWKKGHRCPYCAGQGRPTIEFVRKSFEKNRYNLLTCVYVNSDSYLKYVCPKGHKHSIKWNNWRTGRRCPSCKAIKHSKETSGPGHYNWKGGVTQFNKELRNFIKHIGWSRKILKRDDYKCRMCNKRGGYLIAHHVIPLSFIKTYFGITTIKDAKKCDILYDIDNGLTLCEECHKLYHKNVREELKNYERENYWNSQVVCKKPFIMETLCRNFLNSEKPLTDNAEGNSERSLVIGTCND